MKYQSIIVATLIVSALGCGMDDEGKDKDSKKPKASSSLSARVIYGEDNRADIYQITDSELLRLARSTVALMEAPNITKNPNGTYEIKGDNFGTSYNLCSSEPYREQSAAAFCSGFLVGPKTVVTAGHCVRFTSDCSTVKFVFDYAIKKSGGTGPQTAEADQVFSCAKILKAEVVSTGADYSVIELDRPVKNRLPLAMRTTGSPSAGDSLVVIGHPSGLPTKVSGGAGVRKVNSAYLVSNLDTYGGNSGSAVFNTTTSQIEGVLVRGENDFIEKNGCRVSNQCADTGCRGEDVTLIKAVIPFVDMTPLPPEPADPSQKIYSTNVNLVIPDGSKRGVTSILAADEAPNGRNVSVHVDIAHNFRGDLVVELVSPNGKVARLTNRSGGAQNNLRGTFGLELPAPELDNLKDITASGNWTLRVYDRAKWDMGIFNSWKLIFSN